MKRKDYISPCVSVETILTERELLAASQLYGGELGSRENDVQLSDLENLLLDL